MLRKLFPALAALALLASAALAQRDLGEVVIRPQEIDDVLNNPGIGFHTFQRFNGDTLNGGSGWTEGFPIEYQEFDGDLTNPHHPATTTAYFRVYWRFLEPENDQYDWAMIDKALKTAAERGQTLCLRIAPYGSETKRDVPAWYRQLVGDEQHLKLEKWATDPENPLYVEHYCDMIRDLGARYDGHPDLELVDLSIVGYWGEGAGSEELTDQTRRALVDAYLEAFQKTPLVMLLTDEQTNKYGREKANVGWRVDCLGDLGLLGQGPERLDPHVRLLSPGDHQFRDAGRLEDRPGDPGDLRHDADLA